MIYIKNIEFGINANRFINMALTHISLKDIKRAMSRLADIDLISKTSSEFNAFILLADLCLTLYHGEITKNFSLNYEYS